MGSIKLLIVVSINCCTDGTPHAYRAHMRIILLFRRQKGTDIAQHEDYFIFLLGYFAEYAQYLRLFRAEVAHLIIIHTKCIVRNVMRYK